MSDHATSDEIETDSNTSAAQKILQELADASLAKKETEVLPTIFLEEGVLFPGNVVPVTAREGLRPSDLDEAKSGHLRIAVLAKSADPSFTLEVDQSGINAASVGVEAIVVGLMKMGDEQYGVVLRGLRRVEALQLEEDEGFFTSTIKYVDDLTFDKDHTFKGKSKALKASMLQVLKLNPAISQETAAAVYTSDDPSFLTYLIAPYLSLSTLQKQRLLEECDLRKRVDTILGSLAGEAELLGLSNRIQEEVKGDIHDNMRRGFLREQVAALKKELNELEGTADDADDLAAQLMELPLPEDVRETCSKELRRLEMMHASSPEYMVCFNYLTLIKELPWEDVDQGVCSDIYATKSILEAGHYGLEKVKERFLDYVALLGRRGGPKGEVLLLAGPPGVGKTSLAKSVAEALGKPFHRVSLGGVKDEAEIRGHRRTYVGAMPGKLLQAINQTKSNSPVILLDEIDKVGQGPSGDLSSSLLELLDPEQNKKFVDHYLGVAYDFSKVIFIATANNISAISRPLLDRMELVTLSGYTELEKVHIAKQHLVPKVLKDHVLKKSQLKFTNEAVKMLIRYYTREAGVRQLKQVLSKVARKAVTKLALEHPRQLNGIPVKVNKKNPSIPAYVIDADSLAEWLGVPSILPEPRLRKLTPGVATGLAYTSVGGEILFIETSLDESKSSTGKLRVTGSIGKVMEESSIAARSYLIQNAEDLGIGSERARKADIHMHIPEGATPKDGPSAGVAIFCAIVSAFTKKAIPVGFAMTGEATLRGQILPVGGIKEKVLAAHRNGKKHVILPASNWYDLEELPKSVLSSLTFYPLTRMQDALQVLSLLKGQGKIAFARKYERYESFENVPLSSFRSDRIGLH